jgi:hypothetical protein
VEEFMMTYQLRNSDSIRGMEYSVGCLRGGMRVALGDRGWGWGWGWGVRRRARVNRNLLAWQPRDLRVAVNLRSTVQVILGGVVIECLLEPKALSWEIEWTQKLCIYN